MRKLVVFNCYSVSTSPQRHSFSKAKSIPSFHHQIAPTPPLSVVHSLQLQSTNSAATSAPTSELAFAKHYAAVASSVAEAGQLDEFISLSEFVASSGINPALFFSLLSVENISNGLSSNLTLGNYDVVVKSLKIVQDSGCHSLEKLAETVDFDLLRSECLRLADNAAIDQAVPLMEILSGSGFSIDHIVKPSEFINLCVKRRKPEMAVRFAALVPNECILFCSIINEFGKKKDLESALTAYEEAKNALTSPNMYLHRTIIDVCGRCNDHMKTRLIYEDMLREQITPNIYVINSLLNVNARDFRYVILMYKKMKDLGVVPDVASYNILLKACTLVGRIDVAQEIYREMKQLQARGLLKMDVYSYSTIIKAFADAKLWQLALKVKDDMLERGVAPNMHTWSSLISACANAGIVEQSIKLIYEMQDSGTQPNEQCCNILIHACVAACQYDRAFRFLEAWKGSADHAVHHLNSFPFDIIKRVPFKPTLATYNTLMKACGGNYGRGRKLMEEMKQMGLVPDHISWTCLIEICGNSGHVDGALHILKEMRNAGVEPDVISYTNAIKVCVEAKKLRMAFSLYQEMKSFNVKPNMVTYNTLFKARSKYGSLEEIEQCLAVYQDMLKAGYKANDSYLKQLVEEWCEGLLQIHANFHLESYFSASESESLRNLFLRVATHLRTSVSDSLTVDLQELSPVEARIVVLAVLRKIKDKHSAVNLLKTDMWITFGSNHYAVIPEVLKLLRKDLGLDVHVAASSSLAVGLRRRPPPLQRVKVSRGSLNCWLQRKGEIVVAG